MLYSESLLAGCSCCSEVQSSASVTGVEKPSEAKVLLKKITIGWCLCDTCWEADLPSNPFSCQCLLLISQLYMNVWIVSQLLQCAVHTEDKKWRFFSPFISLFFELKEAAAVDLFTGRIYSEGSVSHWAELRQRHQRGLNERQRINGAIWSPSRLWGCIIKMTRMRLRMVTSLLPAGYAWCLGRWL